MSPEIRELLCRFDEYGAWEFPQGFDYSDLELRAKSVCTDIQDSGVRVAFEGAVYHQDASFSIAISLHSFERQEGMMTYMPTVRFSNFGNLTTVTLLEQIPVATMRVITDSLTYRKFIYVSVDELDCDYDGIMPDKDTFRTWWIRYFDWL